MRNRKLDQEIVDGVKFILLVLLAGLLFLTAVASCLAQDINAIILVNSETDQDIDFLEDGDVVTVNSSLNIRATTDFGVDRVDWRLQPPGDNTNYASSQRGGGAAYCGSYVGTDNSIDYRDCMRLTANGTYRATVTAYRDGVKGEVYSVSFTLRHQRRSASASETVHECPSGGRLIRTSRHTVHTENIYRCSNGSYRVEHLLIPGMFNKDKHVFWERTTFCSRTELVLSTNPDHPDPIRVCVEYSDRLCGEDGCVPIP